MAATTSTHFISAAASGENWRDVARNVLGRIEEVLTDGFAPNIGFLYISEELAEDAPHILDLFRSVTGITHWSGCSAFGVCGAGREFAGVPAISALIGEIPFEKFRMFSARASAPLKTLHQDLEPWLNKHDPMLVAIHADPVTGPHPAHAIEEVEAMVGGFMVGGLCSSRTRRVVFGGQAIEGGVSGFVFDASVPVATALTQGCSPIGALHEITAFEDNVITRLDGRNPFSVFSEDMKAMAEKKLGYGLAEKLIENETGAVPQEILNVIEGQAHVAFPVSGSDRNDYLVRNIIAMDADTGRIAVSENIEKGQKITFVYRDDETMRSDLAKTLISLRERVLHDTGSFQPKAALYISCVARANVSFSGSGESGGETALIREILGDIPLAGFYAGGEISNSRIYGYTGILALFL